MNKILVPTFGAFHDCCWQISTPNYFQVFSQAELSSWRNLCSKILSAWSAWMWVCQAWLSSLILWRWFCYKIGWVTENESQEKNICWEIFLCMNLLSMNEHSQTCQPLDLATPKETEMRASHMVKNKWIGSGCKIVSERLVPKSEIWKGVNGIGVQVRQHIYNLLNLMEEPTSVSISVTLFSLAEKVTKERWIDWLCQLE